MKRFEKILTGKYFPFFLLFIMILTWCIQLPHYGFYLDDWISVAGYDQGGFSALKAYAWQDSRAGLQPLVHALGFNLVGTSPLGWQIYSLFWRYLAGVFNWLLIKKIWRKQQNIAIFSSILLMIFPFFKHQALSIAYVQVWMQNALILLSFLMTVYAIRSDKASRKVLFTLLACVFSAAQLFMTEYFLTIEIARFVLILFTLNEDKDSPKEKTFRAHFVRTLRISVPYLLIWISYLIYRFLIMPQFFLDRNTLELFTEHKTIPGFLINALQLLIQYLSESVWGVWYRSLNPSNFDLTTPGMQAALIIGSLVFILLLFGYSKIRRQEGVQNGMQERGAEGKEILIVGFLAMLLGFLPGMAIDKSPSASFIYHDRFLIPSFWGIVLSVTAFAFCFIKGRTIPLLIMSALCGLAVFFQIQNSSHYRTSWQNQQEFQWQLKWRIPDLEENTAILGDAIIASYMGGWADGAMVFEMYGKNTGYDPTTYWYFVAGEGDFTAELEQKLPIAYQNKIFNFEAKAGNTLILTKREWDRCLWVLDEADLYNPYIQPVTRKLIQYQNKNRIRYDSDYQMPEEVFGSDFEHDWCYFYENAAREVDTQNYESALALYDEAVQENFSMKKPVEMTPFIRAAAMTGQWDLAADLTETAGIEPHITWEYFANLWDSLLAVTPESAERSMAFERIREYIEPQEN